MIQLRPKQTIIINYKSDKRWAAYLYFQDTDKGMEYQIAAYGRSPEDVIAEVMTCYENEEHRFEFASDGYPIPIREEIYPRFS